MAIAIVQFAGLGGAVCVWGALKLRASLSKRKARTCAAEAGGGEAPCICAAHLSACDCSDAAGRRNPRGAGRGRMAGFGGELR